MRQATTLRAARPSSIATQRLRQSASSLLRDACMHMLAVHRRTHARAAPMVLRAAKVPIKRRSRGSAAGTRIRTLYPGSPDHGKSRHLRTAPEVSRRSGAQTPGDDRRDGDGDRRRAYPPPHTADTILHSSTSAFCATPTPSHPSSLTCIYAGRSAERCCPSGGRSAAAPCSTDPRRCPAPRGASLPRSQPRSASSHAQRRGRRGCRGQRRNHPQDRRRRPARSGWAEAPAPWRSRPRRC